VSVLQQLMQTVTPPPTSGSRSRRLGVTKTNEHLCPIYGGRFLQTSDLAVHFSKIHGIKAEVVETEIATAGLVPVNQGMLKAENCFCSDPVDSLTDSVALQRLRSSFDIEMHLSPALSVQ